MEQTYDDVEYVFVDDCSPDGSVDILLNVLRDYPVRQSQVKIVRHERNRGLVAARRTAMAVATGDLIAHCDADDWVDTDLYERMILKLEQEQADLVLCPLLREGPDRRTVRDLPVDLPHDGRTALREFGRVTGLNPVVNKIYRREVADLKGVEWPETISISEDFCYTFQVLPRCRKIVGISGAYYHYRLNASSMTKAYAARRIVDQHAVVYDILTRRLAEADAVPVRRYLVETILYWGTTHAILSQKEFGKWYRVFMSLGGIYAFETRSRCGRIAMRVARISVPLSRLVVRLLRSHIKDML